MDDLTAKGVRKPSLSLEVAQVNARVQLCVALLFASVASADITVFSTVTDPNDPFDGTEVATLRVGYTTVSNGPGGTVVTDVVTLLEVDGTYDPATNSFSATYSYVLEGQPNPNELPVVPTGANPSHSWKIQEPGPPPEE